LSSCACVSRSYVLHAEPDEYKVTGSPIGMVHESKSGTSNGRKVDYRPASDGQALSAVNGDGTFRAELTEPLDRGRQGELHALKILVQVLSSNGDEVRQLSGSDDRGEDGIIVINKQFPVQIVAVIVDKSLWKELSKKSSAVIVGSLDEAASLLRDALVHKKKSTVVGTTIRGIDLAK